MLILLIVFLVFVGIVVVPLAVIWSLNILFGMGIPITWETWSAMLVLLTVISGSKNVGSGRK